jgi:hypothetical protein
MAAGIRTAYAIARGTVAFVYFYHGLVPKLILQVHEELAMLADAGIAVESTGTVLMWFGVVEIVLSVVLIVAWRAAWPLWIALGFMPAALLGVALTSPTLLGGAFNPVSLNLSVAALAMIALVLRERVKT